MNTEQISNYHVWFVCMFVCLTADSKEWLDGTKPPALCVAILL